jgi:TPR repeat protein
MNAVLQTAWAAVLVSATLGAQTVPEARQAIDKGTYPEALKILQPVAEQGNAEAQYGLGVMHWEGHGVPQNYGEAFNWFRKAATLGRAEAQYRVGQMYFIAQGVPQDYGKPRAGIERPRSKAMPTPGPRSRRW